MLTALPTTPAPQPIPAGRTITYVAEGRCATFWTTFASDVRAKAVAALFAKGWVVQSSTVAPKSNERLGDWDYRAEIIARAPVTFASIDDPIATVRGVLWDAAGSPPTVTAQGYNSQSKPTDNPGLPGLPGLEDGWGGIAGFVLVALVLVTATGVFVAKRG